MSAACCCAHLFERDVIVTGAVSRIDQHGVVNDTVRADLDPAEAALRYE